MVHHIQKYMKFGNYREQNCFTSPIIEKYHIMPFGYQETMVENKGMDNMWAELKVRLFTSLYKFAG